METLSDFSKLYGEIDGTLKKNIEYHIKIKQNFDSDSIHTNKSLILTEIGRYGGKNSVLAWVLIGAAVYLSFLNTLILVASLL
jgi:hypothetical protein